MLQLAESANDNQEGLANMLPDPDVAALVAKCLDHLSNSLVGYSAVELKMMLAAASTRECNRVLLVGKHGTGKSTAARILGQLFHAKTAIYNASVDDLISMAGVPNTQRFAAADDEISHIPFVSHPRCIWDKEIVHCDELNRSTPENQNIFLEPLGEVTLYGRPLPMRLFIATINPEADKSYVGTMPLDDALRDRFDIVITVPEVRQLSGDQLIEVAFVNLRNQQAARQRLIPDASSLKKPVEQRLEYLLENPEIVGAASTWCGRVIQGLLKSSPETYISHRSISQFARITLSALAFDSLIDRFNVQSLRKLLTDVACLSLGNKLGLKDEVIRGAVRGQDIDTLLKTIIVPDPLDLVCLGRVSERLGHLSRLSSDEIIKDKARAHMAAEQLLADARNDSGKSIQRFIQSVPVELNDVRLQAEVKLLEVRLETASEFATLHAQRSPTTKVVARTRQHLGHAKNWHPDSRMWSTSLFRRLRTEVSDRNEICDFDARALEVDKSHLLKKSGLPDLSPSVYLFAGGTMAEMLSILMAPIHPSDIRESIPFLELVTAANMEPTKSRIAIFGCREFKNGYAATTTSLQRTLGTVSYWNDRPQYVFKIPNTSIPTFFETAGQIEAPRDRLLVPAEYILRQIMTPFQHLSAQIESIA